jgi:hypothetical protein
MVELALERDNDCAGDQPFFPTSELGFDESKLIEARKNETVPFVQGDQQYRFCRASNSSTVPLPQCRAATDIPMVAFDDFNEDPEDEEVRSGDYGNETRIRPRLGGKTDRMLGLEWNWDIGSIGDELFVPVTDIFFDDTQLLDIQLPVRERRQDETLSFVPVLRRGPIDMPAATDIPVVQLLDDPEGDPEEEEQEVLTPVEVKRTAFSSRSS